MNEFIKHIASSFILILCWQSAIAQHSLSVKTTDNKGETLPFTSILLLSSDLDTIFSSNSRFNECYKIDSLPSQNFHIKVECLFWEPQEFDLLLTSDTIINIILKPFPEEMEEIVVQGFYTPLINKDSQNHYFEPLKQKDCDLDTIQKVGVLIPQEVMVYLRDYLKYTQYAIAEQNQGKVYALITIDSLGEISEIEIKKGISECLDNMVRSAFLTMPRVKMKTKPKIGAYNQHRTDGFEEGEYLFPIIFRID